MDSNKEKILYKETVIKIATPVKTGVQRCLNLLEITGFRLSPE